MRVCGFKICVDSAGWFLCSWLLPLTCVRNTLLSADCDWLHLGLLWCLGFALPVILQHYPGSWQIQRCKRRRAKIRKIYLIPLLVLCQLISYWTKQVRKLSPEWRTGARFPWWESTTLQSLVEKEQVQRGENWVILQSSLLVILPLCWSVSFVLSVPKENGGMIETRNYLLLEYSWVTRKHIK